MGLLKHFRSRSRLNSGPQSPQTQPPIPPTPRQPPGRDCTRRLPKEVLSNIFAYVCPHTQDHTYEPSEHSQIGADGCMLCDLRDLACCAQVCRKWYGVAQKLLYGSVRIDAVHYCALEEELAERRRKAAKHFRKNSSVVEAGEVPNVRLGLLCRTVREQERLAEQVVVLKLPYMTRETAKGELARTVSALPNLRYVDLPDGFFTGDPSCLALRHELQARCPDIRKMSYRAGNEDALELLAHRHWQSIETLELNNLAIELAALRIVLASLPTLAHLTLADMPWLDDNIFQPSPTQLPDFPALHTLNLANTPSVTAQGLTLYLDIPINRERLTTLSLGTTGITVQDLHHVLWKASSLAHLSILEIVSKSLSLAPQNLPSLTSISLRTLHYEIVSSEDVHGLQKPAESYYAYLASSLHSNALPGLATLYVRDQTFPELLTVALPPPPFGNTNNTTNKNNNLSPNPRARPTNKTTTTATPAQPAHFTQTLVVFSKGLDELEWVCTAIAPPPLAHPTSSHQGRYSFATTTAGGNGRPLSAHSASRGLGPQWAQGGFGGEARKSVVVGNGFGGFLAVPVEEVPRPMTSDGCGGGGTRWGNGNGELLQPPPKLSSLAAGGEGRDKRGSRHDLWR